MSLKHTARVVVTAGLCTSMVLGSTPLTAIAEEMDGRVAPAIEQGAPADASPAGSGEEPALAAGAPEGSPALGEDSAGFEKVATENTPVAEEAEVVEKAAVAERAAVADEAAIEPAAEGAFKIGTTTYATLTEAVEAVKSSRDKTIVLTKDAAGNGVAVKSGTDFTLDLGGHSYTIDGATVGSTGTETNGFQLLQNSNITIKNGKITSDKAKILIQNYSNLTLENVQLVGGANTQYTLSNNNGNTVIGAGARLVAGKAAPRAAFDVCGFSSYKSVSVTVEPGAIVEGAIELSSYDNDHACKLDIQGGDLSAATLTAAKGAERVQVKKADAVQLAAPEGFRWVGNQLVTPAAGKVAVTGADGSVRQFATLTEAVKAAQGQPVVLLADITEDVVIDKGTTAVIDLAGHTVRNKVNHTIVNNGTLTVKDSVGGGVVDNVTHARAALVNEVGAAAALEAGTFSRSAEASKNENDSGENSFYTLMNHGTMTIKDGVTVCQGKDNKGRYSSLVENGWYNGADNTGGQPSVMTIEGGTFVGGLNTVKNDDYGELVITGGTFENVKQAAVLNWNVTKILGGTFTSSEFGVLNGYINNTMDKGELTITGGTFTAPVIVDKMGGSVNSGAIAISGGAFEGKFPAPQKMNGTLEISGGAFSDPSAEEFVVPGSGLEVGPNGQLGVARVKLVFDEAVKDGVCTYDVKGGKAPAIDLLSLVRLNVTNESQNYSVVLPDSAAGEALQKAIAAADTSKVHQITVQAFDGKQVVDEQVIRVELVDSAAPAPVAKATVTFRPGVGDPFTRAVEVGSKLERPADPTHEGWEFVGWFTVKNADGTFSNEWDFDKGVVTGDMTLYGGWVKKAAPGQQPAPGKPEPGKPAPGKPALPQTGDASALPMAAAALSGVAALGAAASRRRKAE